MAEMDTLVTVVSLGVLCTIGVLLTAVRLPGTWLIVMVAAGFGWWSDWNPLGMTTVFVLAGVAGVAEILELLMSVFTARRAGASRQAAWGGLIGGMVGMFLFSIPVPVIGTIVGAILGCFTGAALMEWIVRKKLAQGTRVGLFSALGFALGTATKMAVALVMTGIVLTAVTCTPQAGNRSMETHETPPPQHG